LGLGLPKNIEGDHVEYMNNEGQEVPPIIPARPVCDMAVSLTANVALSIRKPPAGGRFELKQNMVHLIHSMGKFISLPHEDHQVHIRNFLEISDTYITNGVSSDYVRLTLFPFSLLGAARQWLNTEPRNSITT